MPDLIGMDCAKDYSNFAAAIKQAGVSFVGRYYRWPASPYAPLTYREAAALSDAGLFVVALWEWISNEISNFSYHDGFAQGSSAYRQAMTTHQPAGTPIYFTVDADFAPDQIAGPVSDYFVGVVDAFEAMGRGNSAYLIGVYGSGLSCSWLLNHNRAQRSWLAGSRDWSGYQGFEDWDIRQSFDDLNIPGLAPGVEGDYDSDVGKSSYGGFQVLT
jgi:Domain of unknown function (DUF1906)